MNWGTWWHSFKMINVFLGYELNAMKLCQGDLLAWMLICYICAYSRCDMSFERHVRESFQYKDFRLEAQRQNCIHDLTFKLVTTPISCAWRNMDPTHTMQFHHLGWKFFGSKSITIVFWWCGKCLQGIGKMVHDMWHYGCSQYRVPKILTTP